MNEEEKETIELDIEAKYVDKTEKEFLSRVTYAECLFILTPENKYCDKIRELSVLKLCEIIEKLQKENEELKVNNDKTIKEGREAILYYTKDSIPKHVIRDKFYEVAQKRKKYWGKEYPQQLSKAEFIKSMKMLGVIKFCEKLLGE